MTAFAALVLLALGVYIVGYFAGVGDAREELVRLALEHAEEEAEDGGV